MTISRLEKRIIALEAVRKNQVIAGLQFDCFDNRVLIYKPRGVIEEKVFTSTAEAAQYVEKFTNDNEYVTGQIIAYFCDLFPEESEVKNIITQKLNGRELISHITLTRKNKAGSFNFILSAIANAARNFNTCGFHQRFATKKFSDEDNRLLSALYTAYCYCMPNNDHDAQFIEFMSLISFIGKIPAMEAQSE